MTKVFKPVYGFGINDLGLKSKDPVYQKWVDMLKRCYSAKHLDANPSYYGVTVCDDWLKVSAFSYWLYLHENWETLELDKDLKGGKIYSPSTCLFVPHYVNSLFVMKRKEHEYPLGVSLKPQDPRMVSPHSNPYRARIRKDNKEYSLGHHYSVESAHAAWQLAKVTHIKEVIDRYRREGFYNKEVEDSLINIYKNIEQDLQNQRPTTREGMFR